MPRVNRLYTIDAEVALALAARSDASHVPMSRIVEEGLRHVLAMPLPEKAEGENTESATRTEKAMLETLAGLPRGWHSGVDLAIAVGVSFHVGEKALKGLARRGAVVRWGDAKRFSDGSEGGGCWGLHQPVALVTAAITRWRTKGGKESDQAAFKLLGAVRELAKGMSPADVAAVREAMREVVNVAPEDLGVWNFAELAERVEAD